MSIIVVQYKCYNPSSVLSKGQGNNGISEIGGTSMPQKFRNEDGGASFASGRNEWRRVPLHTWFIYGYGDIEHRYCGGLKTIRAEFEPGPIHGSGYWSKSNIVIPGRRRNAEYTSCKCYYNGKQTIITSSEEYIHRKKRIAIGKGSNNKTPFAFKDNDICSDKSAGGNHTQHPNRLAVADAKRRCRNGGYVVPPKCRGGGCRQPQGWPVTQLLGGTACQGWNTK